MKPPYRIPSMAEIHRTAPNGLSVVSTFSGCGGSCLGFQMAGYRARWANEFVPAAAETYAANHPFVVLSTADIREVHGADILSEIGETSVDVLEGSPPCASFSTAGKGSANWGQVKKYSDVEQRVDDLFFEYVRLVEELQPRAFVAENVSGLVRGVSKGYFKQIHRRLVSTGYRVEARLLDAQWLGVPQVRRRVIFVGFRNDLDVEPVFPTPLPYNYTVADALDGVDGIADSASVPWIAEFAIGVEWDKLRPGESSDRFYNLVRPRLDRPVPTITQTSGNVGAASVTHPTLKRKFTIPELRRLCGFPDDFVLTGTYQQQAERLGRAVPPPMMRAVAAAVATRLAPEAASAASGSG